MVCGGRAPCYVMLVVGFLVVVVVAAAAAAAVMRKLRIWDLREVPHDVNVGNVCAAIY